MLELDLELHQEEIKNVNGGCACTCTCFRDGAGGSSSFLGEMQAIACAQACNSLSHGGRLCSANCT